MTLRWPHPTPTGVPSSRRLALALVELVALGTAALADPRPAQSAAATVVATTAEISARLPSSSIQISLDAPGFVESPELGTTLSQQVGDRALIYGHFELGTLMVIVEPDEPHRESAQWRDLAGPGEPFDVGGTACRRTVQELPDGARIVRYKAFPVAAGSVLDVHVTSSASSGDPAALHGRFEELVRSIRIQYVRRGRPSDLPRDVRDGMDRALRSWPRWRDALPPEPKPEAGREPGPEPAAPEGEAGGGAEPAGPAPEALFARAFVLAQLAHFEGARPTELVALHDACVAAFDALREPGPAHRFAGALALETLGVSRAVLGNVGESVEPLERALAIANELGHEARAGLAYNLACSHARLGALDAALGHLADAIAVDPRYRIRAVDDPDFQGLAAEPRFVELVRRER